MSRLLAYMGNDPQRVRCVLHPGRGVMVGERAEADAWGVGFFHSGEVLLQRRPKPPEAPIDLFEVASETKTDALIAQLRAPGSGAPSNNDNTPPYRFRSWLFAQVGPVAGLRTERPEVLKAIPDFLRRNLRGDTDSEHLFHLFLSFLHDANKLDDPMIQTKDVAHALADALALQTQITESSGPSPVAACVSNGRVLVAARRGLPMYSYKIGGVRDCAVCRDASAGFEPERRARPRGPDHEHLKGVVMIAEPTGTIAAPWEELPDQSVVAVSHELQITVTPLAEAARIS